MPSNVYSIPAAVGFADALATRLLAENHRDLSVLSDTLLLLPTRRACRAVREAFLRASGGEALILPRLQPIGDVDEDEMLLVGGPADDVLSLPPPISDTKRLMLLTRLVLARNTDTAITAEQAVRLAKELAALLDQVETEGLSFEALKGLVHGTLATHWEETLAFLEIVSDAWPRILEENSEIDPADRRARLLRAQANAWRVNPPETPIVIAGSTGTIPATAELLKVVANLPRGRVVLPGLDRLLDEVTWQAVLEDETHPQNGMSKLLDGLGVGRDQVDDWTGETQLDEGVSVRVKLISEAMRPASRTGSWHKLEPSWEDALVGVDWLEAPDDEAEARAIALALRAELEVPERTAALVTPDRTLARRVAAELARWDISIDDSAGLPLSETEKPVFLRLVAQAAVEELSPVALLAMLKHPMCRLGLSAGAVRGQARLLERTLLRGPKPPPGLEGLSKSFERARGTELSDTVSVDQRRAIETRFEIIGRLLASLSDALRRFTTLMSGREPVSPSGLLRAHIVAAETLAASDTETGADRLWRGDDGEALADVLSELSENLEPSAGLGLPAMRPREYPGFLEAALSSGTVRPRYGLHPRLAILGPLEARLLSADLVVLGGLVEGVWPPEPSVDAWMSRPMRKRFGLPPSERRIGLSAHDFAQAASAPKVLLTRAVKSGGQPTVPSRWLERLAVVATKAGAKDFAPERNKQAADLLRWQREMDDHSPVSPIEAPAPTPPLEARPNLLSVTRIETWRRDPYGLYARSILKLEPLDDLEADLTAADKGSIIHDALDRFVREHRDLDTDTAVSALIEIGERSFGSHRLSNPAVRAFWWPRFARIASWFIHREEERRAGLASLHSEIAGRLEIPRKDGGVFTLYARADRVDETRSDSYAILDYKTGAPPSSKDIEAGYAPQLPLEAAIAMAGGFEGLPEGKPVTELAFWRLSGGSEAGEIKSVKPDDIAALAKAALDGLELLVATFDDPSTPYTAIPRPDKAPRYNDYAHLARVREWSVRRGDGETG